MLAFAWPWGGSGDGGPDLGKRLAASLCAGIGGQASVSEAGALHFAYRPLKVCSGPPWQPANLPSGRIAAFHGYFDNLPDIAAQLDAAASNPSLIYGLAVERWGDDADRRVIGEYCAVIVEPASFRIRLARSPLRAPPLCYFQGDQLAAAASVPRALFAAGAERRLNEAHAADSAMLNFTDPEPSWFEGIYRVPLGSTVELGRGRDRELRQFYDLAELPKVRMATKTDYVARAGELLDEGVQACLAGFRQPGATLSGGLDSPQVAVRALTSLPGGKKLPTFTFHPDDEFDGRVERGKLADERPFVEAFASMHPGLEPHFTANEGYGHDHRWNEFFHLMGGAPAGLPNMYVFHGLLSGAARRGCDVLLLAEWGNLTFSDRGDSGYVEYFLKGRWIQLWKALAREEFDDRPLPVRFLARCIQPLLPNGPWEWMRRLVGRGGSLTDLIRPLSPSYRTISGADRRLKASGMLFERYEPRNRRHALALQLQNHDSEAAEIYQAFEQMYGVAQRDPTAYRPFVEFCAGLPVDLFLHDGTKRWLAKEMAKGIMPDAQRLSPLHGRWDSDWHLRVGRRKADYLAEIDRLATDERMAAMLDLPRLKAALEDLPDQTELDRRKYFGAEFAVPRGLLTARFVNYVEGRNQ
jgi:asparagine synthase (glutamine-hydrolysing)